MTALGQPPVPPPSQPAVLAPPPPPGPGVVPPFPAPPVEGRGLRLGIGLGIGAVVLVLACGGGIAGFAGLSRIVTNAVNEQADVVVGDYLDALRAGNYADAYDQLCDEAKTRETESAFTNRVSGTQQISDYEIGNVDMIQLSAPVDVTYVDGDTGRLRAYLGPDSRAGGYKVCRVEE
jgi:hypothetical protein